MEANHQRVWDSNTFIAPSHELISSVKLFLTDYNAEKMVSSLNSKLCNTLSDLLNRCTPKFINSSHIYPQLDLSIYDSMCNEEWSEVIHNPSKINRWVVYEMQHLLIFICLHSLDSSHGWYKPEGVFYSVFCFQIYARRLLVLGFGIFVVAQF